MTQRFSTKTTERSGTFLFDNDHDGATVAVFSIAGHLELAALVAELLNAEYEARRRRIDDDLARLGVPTEAQSW